VAAKNEAIGRAYERRHRAAAPSPEEAEAAESATSFYEALGSPEASEAQGEAETAPEGGEPLPLDPATFCDLMSEAALAQTVRYAEVASGLDREWDCESAVELLVARSKRAGQLDDLRRAEVLGVNVKGDKATATVRFGDGAATSVPLVKEDGEWKLAGAGVGGGQ